MCDVVFLYAVVLTYLYLYWCLCLLISDHGDIYSNNNHLYSQYVNSRGGENCLDIPSIGGIECIKWLIRMILVNNNTSHLSFYIISLNIIIVFLMKKGLKVPTFASENPKTRVYLPPTINISENQASIKMLLRPKTWHDNA